MSTKHLLDSEGAVFCEAAPTEDGSNVTSRRASVTCPDCLRSPVEAEVQHWGDYDSAADEAFWVKEAMQSAVGAWWYPQRHTALSMADEVTLTVDRIRGVVTLKENA